MNNSSGFSFSQIIQSALYYKKELIMANILAIIAALLFCQSPSH